MPDSFRPPRPERTLTWDGCLNVRDLGGHRTEDGRTTRFGAVVRADSVRALSDAGWDELLDYGVSRIQPDAAGSTRAVYLEFLERRRPQFAEAFAAVANAPEGTVVVHCHGGKDRTGLVVALLLRLVDVDIGTIAADYALSGYNLREQTAAWVVAAEDDLERERRRRIGSAPAEAMVAVLEELERRYSSVREYLGAAGVPDETIDAAAARLL
ncbi:MAG: tyrosine-protein phosphatase [Actinobacteria bacterium]|nr:MAG: tyrosine-protein phosphatase [Actinomycetota bacterium]